MRKFEHLHPIEFIILDRLSFEIMWGNFFSLTIKKPWMLFLCQLQLNTVYSMLFLTINTGYLTIIIIILYTK